MLLKIKNGFIFDDDGLAHAVVVQEAITPEDQERFETTIELGSELIPAVEKFISDVNSGKFKPRSVVKELESILSKHK